jgi:hypothetical protein
VEPEEAIISREQLSKHVSAAANTQLWEAVFFVWSTTRLYDKILFKLLGSWVGRQSPASKDVNSEADESTSLGAITRQRLVKTQQAEKT